MTFHDWATLVVGLVGAAAATTGAFLSYRQHRVRVQAFITRAYWARQSDPRERIGVRFDLRIVCEANAGTALAGVNLIGPSGEKFENEPTRTVRMLTGEVDPVVPAGTVADFHLSFHHRDEIDIAGKKCRVVVHLVGAKAITIDVRMGARDEHVKPLFHMRPT